MDGQPLAWWMWIVLGLLLALAEILTPGGFYLIFFGVGAIAVGILRWLIPGMPFALQGLIFVVLSILSVLLFRKPLLERLRSMRPNTPVDNLIGETARAMEEIAARGLGKAELRGTSWTVQNMGDEPIANQQRCRVERVEGLTLFVRSYQ